MKWFKHQSDAHMNAKLQKILIKYGAQGYGLYWFCLECVAGNISDHKLTFELEHDAEILAHHLKMDSRMVEEIMTYMVSLGLFENRGGTITCLKMAKRMDQSMTSSPAMRRLIEKNRVQNGDYSGYVYFVEAQSGNDTRIKIGRSKNPTTRLDELKRRSDCEGWELRILHKIKSGNCVDLETRLHKKFNEINLENEWFLASSELIHYIKALRSDEISLRVDYDMQDKTRLDKTRLDKKKREGATSRPKLFKPPTEQEVASYIREKRYRSVNAKTFVTFYESKGWMVGKNKMKDWRKAVSGWESRSVKDKPSRKDFSLGAI